MTTMRCARLFWIASACVALSLHHACGGDARHTASTPTVLSPDHPAGTVLAVVSGETRRPVPGASVTVAGRKYTTDMAGEVRLAEPVWRSALVDILASGFLDRQTTMVSGQPPRFSLWPKASTTGLNEHTTAELVYTSAASCCPAASLGSVPLRRVSPTIRTFAVVLDPRYRANGDVMAAIQEGASLAGAASGARVVFAPADTSTGPRIDITSGPDPLNRPNVAAFANVQLDGQGYIVGGQVVFVMEDYLTGRRSHQTVATIMAHELGHMLGLGHSSTPGVMSVLEGRGTNYAFFFANGDFSPAEKLVLDIMYERRSGNRFPDNDRQAAATSVGREQIVCRF
jgi:Matrixin